MKIRARGAAMAETALTMGLVSMLLFGTIQLALLGYAQISQDGAAFIAARAYAQNPAGGLAYARSAAAGVFEGVSANSIGLTTQGRTVTSGVTSTASGLPAPGAPSTVTVNGGATEPMLATPAPNATPGAFSVTATLSNYRTAAGTLPSTPYGISIAQTFYGGNGHNGRFAEFYCRASVYAGISFPAQRPTALTPAQAQRWDPTQSSSPLYQVYQWDTGTTTCA